MREQFYLATLADDAHLLAAKYGLGLEIDEFCTAMNFDADFDLWDGKVRSKLPCADRHILHAPFAELTPCAIDPLIREVSLRRLTQAANYALKYGIRRMVAHSGFLPDIYYPTWFLEQGTAFFRELLSRLPNDFEIMLENVLDEDPALLRDLIQSVDDRRLRACLDVGHAHCASKVPVGTWLSALSPVLTHLHIHDNDGTRDRHRVPGQGTIGYPALFEAIAADAPDATMTLECVDARGCVDMLLSKGLI